MLAPRTFIALALVVSCVVRPALAQVATDAPRIQSAAPLPEWLPAGSPANAAKPRYDSEVVEPVSFVPPADAALAVTASQSNRRLAPRDERPRDRSEGERLTPSRLISDFGLRFDSLYSTLAALAIVLGLFFVCVWGLRRGTRKSVTMLPSTVVNVLGRVSLAPKRFAELLRVGNKLVLVVQTPNGLRPLTEVTDPAEVDRLLGLCQQSGPHSTSQEFEQMFRELASDRAPAGFLGDEVPVISVQADSPSYRSRGGGRRV
jgi:flagellar biogenesis protein FliO